MTNIIKETLEKTFNELNEQIQHHEALRRVHLTNKANHIVTNIDDLFKEFHIQVSDTNIDFKFTEDSWYDFRIERNQNYKADGYEYGKAYISSSSSSNNNDKSLKRYICLGQLARHCLYNTNGWTELVSLMDESNELYKANIGPLYKQVYQIEAELRKINKEEQNKQFNDVFNKNTFVLSKPVYFYYGNGKWDRANSDEWFWEENKGGKTYNVSYIDVRRTNPWYDAEGKDLEGVYERIKRSINKRIKKADIESFVRSCTNLVVEEVIH
jgi:hypothetical protein